MHVDELLRSPEMSAISETTWQSDALVIPKDWTQGRTAFGGISAAMAYQAIATKVTDERKLRSFTTNFIGPLQADQPFTIVVCCLRTGKSVSHYTAQIMQNDHVCVFSQACFGMARKSKVRVDNTDTHGMQWPLKAKYIPQIPKVTPKFFQHFDLSIAEGSLPFTNKSTSCYHGFMRYKKAPVEMTDAHLIAMIDAWPPTLLQMLRWPAPASTVSWNLEFIHPHHPVSGEDWFAYQVNTRQAAGGYGHTEATIWNRHNDVVAISRQTVAVFD
ncbi:acyl-CoA thioesterase II [Aestuariibacter sp. A3R04]|uniref:acyl-CoA thioesterase n=1 Tax=Aestuariibacter sp. A3R04 TaxID=2841571 RepID=UPI001C09EC67|nr:thioesterase family protein [Aestuariibacter sp. A3R04]MBU3022673.1 thioesterase family protein [Aestuariibacter sp. A3R04]